MARHSLQTHPRTQPPAPGPRAGGRESGRQPSEGTPTACRRGGAMVSIVQTQTPFSRCAHSPTHSHPHPVSDCRGPASILKAPAGSFNLSFPPLTQVPPEPLYPAPEQRPNPCEQAVQQGDTDVPPLPTVLGSRSWRGQQLQRPAQPPEGGEGGAGHKEPPGRHGLVGGLDPVQSLGPLRSQPGLIQCQLRGLCAGFRTGTGPRPPRPTAPLASAPTFPGFDHAPITRLGGDWSSRGATPRSPRSRSRPALAGDGGLGAPGDQAWRPSSGGLPACP